MKTYNKKEVREKLNIEQIYGLLEEWGGLPEYTDFGILSSTICHNPPGEGSRKLYYYSNTDLFQCYTGCGSFDIFELLVKVAKIQWNKEFDLNDAVRYIAIKFGLAGEQDDIGEEALIDWKTLNAYDRIQELEIKDYHVELKEYDSVILDRMNYNVKILPWLREGITQEVMNYNRIGYYPGAAQITIPHFDINGRFIGLRGRALCQPDIDMYGKYRPIMIPHGEKPLLYNHPLGMNLYNINNSKNNIKQTGRAIIFEGEKSSLLYQSYFGIENDISVACCGSSISAYQIQLLLDCGVQEITIAFDRQFQEIGDDEFKHLTNNLTKINDRYKNYVDISIIFDKKMITGYKDSPIDDGADTFLKLWRERIKL
jgi:hypothetical protein